MPRSSAGAAQTARHDGGWRRAVSRWVSREELYVAREKEASAREGGEPCSGLGDRHHVRVCGTLRSVTLRPRAGTPALEAEVFDGTGALSVIWLGRREIRGIEAGRRIRVEGLVSVGEGRKVMYNPRYELVPTAPPSPADSPGRSQGPREL